MGDHAFRRSDFGTSFTVSLSPAEDGWAASPLLIFETFGLQKTTKNKQAGRRHIELIYKYSGWHGSVAKLISLRDSRRGNSTLRGFEAWIFIKIGDF